MKRLVLIPYAFVLMNWAAMRALFCFLRRRRLSSLWVDAGSGATSSATKSWLAEEMLDDLSGSSGTGRRALGGKPG